MQALIADVLTWIWIVICVVTLPYCAYCWIDARRDVQVRHDAGINSGKEELAKLLVNIGMSLSFAFLMFLIAGAYLASPLVEAPGWWRGLVIPTCLILGELSLAIMVIRYQRTRARVLRRDIDSKEIQSLAAVDVANERLDRNTASLNEHIIATKAATLATEAATLATEAATVAMQNGPLQAQKENTVEVQKNTIEVEQNTAAVEILTKIEIQKREDGE